jgi:SPP1 gp7 family putative phage head morphogenesis protein
MDAERERMTALGIRAVKPITRRARVAALRAYRRGDDPAVAMRAEIMRAVPMVTDAMVASHLAGMLRSQITARRAMGDRIALADPYRSAIEFTKRRMDLTDADLAGIQTRYGEEAQRVIGDLSGYASGKVDAAVLEAVKSGEHVRGGVARIREAMDAAGIGGDAGVPDYAIETVYRTQVQMGYSAGRWESNQAPEIQEVLWGFEYSARDDDRTRPTHAALDGFTAPKDDPAWKTITPPNGYSCRCSVVEIFHGDTEAVRFGSLAPVEIDGVMVKPGADVGFEFNPGEVFAGVGA